MIFISFYFIVIFPSNSHLDLQSAKKLAEKQGKWIAIVINDENFPSLALNRDIFNEPKQSVKKLMKKNFIFLRMRFDDREGAQILQNYKLLEHSIPILLIIDSITGELRKNFGDTKDLKLISVVKELKKYTIEDNQMKYVSNLFVDLNWFIFILILSLYRVLMSLTLMMMIFSKQLKYQEVQQATAIHSLNQVQPQMIPQSLNQALPQNQLSLMKRVLHQ